MHRREAKGRVGGGRKRRKRREREGKQEE